MGTWYAHGQYGPATAVTYGPFIQAAEAQYSSHPSVVNPATITNMPAGYKLVRTIQMTDFLGPEQSRVCYGYVATGGDPGTAVVALRGTESTMEWWDDFHWDLVPFTQIPNGGKVARRALRRAEQHILADLQPGRRRSVLSR